MINYAVKVDHIKSNPLKKVGRFRDAYFTHEQEALHYYTTEQFRRYIAVAEKYKDESLIDNAFFVFFNIAYFTGMRKGEINALKWSDIEDNLIHVRRSIAQKTKGGYQETPPKNKSSYRTLQMPQKLVLILTEHLMLQKRLKGFSSNLRVCGGHSTLSDTYIESKNKQFAEEAGLPHIRIHDFRHSHASLLVNNGINIQEVARRLGHSNVNITWQTYSHLYPREEERAVEVLNGV
jgi:integrase